MVKTELKLKNGTIVTVEGTPEEVQRVLASMGAGESGESRHDSGEKHALRRRQRTGHKLDSPAIDHAAIANTTRSCEEAELIEERVLDKPTLENKVLLPLFVVHKYAGEHLLLTSGDVNKITKQLGIPVDQGAASRCLGKSGLVMGDSVRKKGRAVGYKLNRRGVKHFEALFSAERQAAEQPAPRSGRLRKKGGGEVGRGA